TVHALVYSVWITTAAFAAVDRDLESAARDLGAAPLRVFMTVTLPLAAPGVIASAIFVFLESLDEFTGTYFVGVPDVTTLPL
ncbi:ABC transporter permease, partial [Escherichia coli]